MKVYMLLDRSQSMTNLWDEALGAINGYVETIENKKAEVYLAVFDSISYDVLRDGPVSKWKNVKSDEVSPRGSTPLYDSVDKLITAAIKGKHKKSVIVIQTDGFENASKEVTLDGVKKILKEVEKKKWPTLFLGANFDKVESVASTLGFASANSMNISAKNLAHTYRGLVGSTNHYFSKDATAASTKKAFTFTAEIKTKAVS